MSAKSKKIVRKFRRTEDAAEKRWTERDKTLQRRQARHIKTITRTA